MTRDAERVRALASPTVRAWNRLRDWLRGCEALQTARGGATARWATQRRLPGLAPSVGARVAATETYYGLSTFGGWRWGSWSDDIKKKWDIPMNLGEPARKAIKGNTLDYYLSILGESREKNLAELRKRDDKWLALVDHQAANNHAK